MPKATAYRSTVLTSPKPCRKKPNAELSLTRDPYYCCLNVLLTVCYCRASAAATGALVLPQTITPHSKL